MLPVVLVVTSLTTAIVFAILPLTLVVTTVTPAIVLAMLPAPSLVIAVSLAMVFVALRVVLSVMFPVIAKIGTPGFMVAGRPL
jgi:hypothetical protein